MNMKKYNPKYNIKFDESEYQKEFLLIDIQNKYRWKDGKKTEEIEGLKATLIELESYEGLTININALDIDSLGVEKGNKVSIIFDDVRSKLFVNKQGFLEQSIWGTLKLTGNNGSEKGWS